MTTEQDGVHVLDRGSESCKAATSSNVGIQKGSEILLILCCCKRQSVGPSSEHDEQTLGSPLYQHKCPNL